MYNVLEKLRSGKPLSVGGEGDPRAGAGQRVRQLHDELDAAVFDAYGWPLALTDEEILERLVAFDADAPRRKPGPHPLAAARIPGACRTRRPSPPGKS